MHARIVGLKREKHKQLIVEHLQRNQKGYAYEFKEALQELSATTVRNILYDLKKQGVIEFIGPKKTGYWQLIKH